MIKLIYNYELYHHGILGQKWGIRRFQKIANTSETSFKKVGEGSKGVKSINDRLITKEQEQFKSNMNVSRMSDKELQAAVNRMQLEKNYKALSAEKVGSGKKRVSSIMSTIGDVVTVGASIAGIVAAITKAIGDKK